MSLNLKVTLTCLLFASSICYAQTQQKFAKFPIACNDFLKDLPDSNSQFLLNRIRQLGMINLGDFGDASGEYAKMRAPYQEVIDSFSSMFNQDQLIEIINKNYCPLITANAYFAFLPNRDTSQNDSALMRILKGFVSDTISMLGVDGGCLLRDVFLFDLMLGEVRTGFKPITYRCNQPVRNRHQQLSRKNMKYILDLKEGFYIPIMARRKPLPFIFYRSLYLKSIPKN